jgi:hypothetical protein
MILREKRTEQGWRVARVSPDFQSWAFHLDVGRIQKLFATVNHDLEQ